VPLLFELKIRRDEVEYLASWARSASSTFGSKVPTGPPPVGVGITPASCGITPLRLIRTGFGSAARASSRDADASVTRNVNAL